MIHSTKAGFMFCCLNIVHTECTLSRLMVVFAKGYKKLLLVEII